MPPKPDLSSHNLASFLDRFVYKNVKTVPTASKGSSIMQPLSGSDNKGALLSNKTPLSRQAPLNTEAFWQKRAEDVAVDEVFFHKYFNQVGKSKRASSKKTQATEGNLSDGEEDENEDEIWQALVESRPEVEGPSDDDSDMEMLDLDESADEAGSEDEVDVESDLEVAGSSDEDIGLSDELLHKAGSDDDENLDELFSKEVQHDDEVEEEGDRKDSKETSRQRKKRMKSLPTFASIEDYAAMLDNDEDEDF